MFEFLLFQVLASICLRISKGHLDMGYVTLNNLVRSADVHWWSVYLLHLCKFTASVSQGCVDT
jgi:hypothetical protein